MSFKAGTACVCITPDEPFWLAGFAVRSAPSCGTISDLYATALALEDESGQRFVIASMDIIAITPTIANPVAEIVRIRHGLSRKQLLLAPTHTHYGPEFRSDKQVFFNIPDKYGAKLPAVALQLTAALTQVIDQALARLEPVRLFVRNTTTGFAHNRRRHGVVGGASSIEDVVDHDVPVLDCVDNAGQRKAIVFGYACHNTTIPPGDLRYCGDWAGFAKEHLKQDLPTANSLFIPGAGADQGPEPSGSVELSRQYGEEIANAVVQSLNAPGTEITGSIRAEWEEVSLTLQPTTPDSLKKMLKSEDLPQRAKARFLLDQLERGEKLITSYAAPIQVVRFGNELLIVALSGEPVVDWAQKFKREFGQAAESNKQKAGILPFSHPNPRSPVVWVAGYCNDMFGYVPTHRVQAEGGYEGGRANLWSWIPAPFTDDLEYRINDAVCRLVKRSSE